MRHSCFSHSTQPILWMISSVFFFAVSVIFIRLLSQHIHPFQIVFFRNFTGIFVMLPVIAIEGGYKAFYTPKIKLHIIRAILAFISLICWYTAIAHIPLAEATTISFMTPIFATFGAIVFLNEKNNFYKWMAIFTGFLGILITLQPGLKIINPYSFLVIIFAILVAFSSIILKKLSKIHSSSINVSYTLIFVTPLSFLIALPFWETISPKIIPWLITLSVASILGHICFNKALAEGDISIVLPFDYLKLPLIAILSYFLFQEETGYLSWLGSLLIFGGSCYIAHQSTTMKK